jgi:two-component system chemotaxis response regulator CheY
MRDGGYRCVTVDLSLGNHGGLEVLRHLAQLKFEEPVIVVSGSEDDVRGEAAMVARRLGLNVLGSFGKPIDLSRLRVLLGEIRKRQVVGLTPRGS